MLKFKAVVLLGVSAVVAAAALILVLTNMGDPWDLHFYWRNVSLRPGWMLLIAGVVGCLIWRVCRVCVPAGITALRAAKRAGKTKDAPK